MRCVRPAGAVFFPLDDKLELLPGQLIPLLHEHLMRLGAWMPFAPAVALWLGLSSIIGQRTLKKIILRNFCQIIAPQRAKTGHFGASFAG